MDLPRRRFPPEPEARDEPPPDRSARHRARPGGRRVLRRARGLGGVRPQAAGIPTARVLRGEVDTSIHATGELKSTKTTTLTAPAVGGQLRLVTLKPTGAAVTAGEIVMAFDPSDQENKLLESRAELLEADLEIEKLNVDNAVQIAQDKVDLLTARFDVRKAELDITGNELLSAIKAVRTN